MKTGVLQSKLVLYSLLCFYQIGPFWRVLRSTSLEKVHVKVTHIKRFDRKIAYFQYSITDYFLYSCTITKSYFQYFIIYYNLAPALVCLLIEVYWTNGLALLPHLTGGIHFHLQCQFQYSQPSFGLQILLSRSRWLYVQRRPTQGLRYIWKFKSKAKESQVFFSSSFNRDVLHTKVDCY